MSRKSRRIKLDIGHLCKNKLFLRAYLRQNYLCQNFTITNWFNSYFLEIQHMILNFEKCNERPNECYKFFSARSEHWL